MARIAVGSAFVLTMGAAACDEPLAPTEHVHWVDAVQVGGNRYYAVGSGPSPVYVAIGRALVEADLGLEVGFTRFRIAGNVQDPDYALKDGDATYLEEGTRIHRMTGYAGTFRLIADTPAGLRLYERAFNDGGRNASTGADLLDLEGRVARIGVNSPLDGTTELASIDEPSVVSRLVESVLTAPAGRTQVSPDERRYFIAFHFEDGTATARSFWPRTGELQGVVLPASFGEEIDRFLQTGAR